MSVSITVQLVETDGHINVEASEKAFSRALAARLTDLETEQEQIAEAVSALYDRFPGQAIGMPAVASMTAQALNAQPENFKVLSDRVLDYVRANSQETGSAKEGNLQSHPDSLFVIAKGKNGGCYRRADRPAKTA